MKKTFLFCSIFVFIFGLFTACDPPKDETTSPENIISITVKDLLGTVILDSASFNPTGLKVDNNTLFEGHSGLNKIALLNIKDLKDAGAYDINFDLQSLVSGSFDFSKLNSTILIFRSNNFVYVPISGKLNISNVNGNAISGNFSNLVAFKIPVGIGGVINIGNKIPVFISGSFTNIACENSNTTWTLQKEGENIIEGNWGMANENLNIGMIKDMDTIVCHIENFETTPKEYTISSLFTGSNTGIYYHSTAGKIISESGKITITNYTAGKSMFIKGITSGTWNATCTDTKTYTGSFNNVVILNENILEDLLNTLQ